MIRCRIVLFQGPAAACTPCKLNLLRVCSDPTMREIEHGGLPQYVVPLHEFFLKFPSGSGRYTRRLSRLTCTFQPLGFSLLLNSLQQAGRGGASKQLLIDMHALFDHVSKMPKDLSFKEGCVIKPWSMLRAWCLASGGDSAASTRMT